MFAMTHPVTNWFSKLALNDKLALILAILAVALVIITVVGPDTSSVKPKLSESGHPYQLTPIPAGAK
jgi:hypothetical protein